MYNIHDYGTMILYRSRTEAYAQALRARVTPDAVVLDLGAGPGILTLVACQAGARKVYAVEPGGAIEIARQAVAASGFADRVRFIQALSTETSLPEKVDVIVADVHGILPLSGASLLSILDARDRFLKPGGFLIPEHETLWMAVAGAPALHKRLMGPWRDLPGMEFEAAIQSAANTWEGTRLPESALVTEARQWAALDYRQLTSLNAKGGAQWTIARESEAHGIGAWYECATAPGASYSNSPACTEEYAYQHAFFPWPETARLEAGDEVSVELRADYIAEDYLWSWSTQIREAGPRRALKAAYRQSDFNGAPLSRDYLAKSGSAFVPTRQEEAEIDAMILELFGTAIHLEEISRRVCSRFPGRFPDWRAAFTRVAAMSRRYSR